MEKLPKKISKYYKCQIFKYRFIGLLVVLVFIGSIGGFLASSARGQGLQTQVFTVTPPTVSVAGDPGYYTEGTMGVINDSDTPLVFKAEMKDFIVQDNVGTPEILPANTLMKTYSAAAWMGVSPQVFTIQPKTRQNLNYFIQIPGQARPGGHYAAVVFTPVPPKGQVENTGSVVNGQIGTLFSITVKGPITEKATVTKFFANGFQEYGPVNILTQIKNFGDLHIRPAGYITVSDILGRKAILPLKENNIFPQAARDYENQFGGKFMIGRFKAELLASYGVNNNLPLTATLYFWIFPWKIVVVVILIVIALILGSMYYRKNGLKKPSLLSKKGKKEEVPVTPEAPKES
ncbi:MAG: hypothetical protein M1444_01590 [Patescibacteria group bacterium]|nr:hypothetical protein [Patescibacteria group bacterium]